MATPRARPTRLGPQAPSEQEERPASFRERARLFILGEQAEHERFGIFDPFLRWTYAVGSFIAAVLAAGSLLELTAAQGAGIVAAAAAFVAVLLGAWRGHGRIWRKPSEREILLQMAREDDEARALRERLKREDIEARKRV